MGCLEPFSLRFVLLVTVLAIDRSALSGLERDFSGLATLRAGSGEHSSGAAAVIAAAAAAAAEPL